MIKINNKDVISATEKVAAQTGAKIEITSDLKCLKGADVIYTDIWRLLVRVTDTGCGIPEEYRWSIFQPFFRVDKARSREYGGVGLGLSLVWEIADLHGGAVRVEESSENGTTIVVKIPD